MADATTYEHQNQTLLSFTASRGPAGKLIWDQGNYRFQDDSESYVVLHQYSPPVQKTLVPDQRLVVDVLGDTKNRRTEKGTYEEDPVDQLSIENLYGWKDDLTPGGYFWFNFSPKHKQAAVAIPCLFQVVMTVRPIWTAEQESDITFGSDSTIKVVLDAVDVLDKTQTWFDNNVVPTKHLQVSATIFGYFKDLTTQNRYIILRVWVHHGIVSFPCEILFSLTRSWRYLQVSLGLLFTIEDTYSRDSVEREALMREFRRNVRGGR